MIDVSKTIAPKSDQLNADDLIGKDIIVKITKVSKSETPEQPIWVNYEGDNGKPYKPCKSMRRVMVQIWGKDGQSYVGKWMKLRRDDDVLFGGVKVGGIRISEMSDMMDGKSVTLALTASKTSRKPYVVKPLQQQQASVTQSSDGTVAPIVDPIVKNAGEAAAAKGVADYVAWRDALDPAVKESIRPLNKEWSNIAQAADKAKKPTEKEVPFGDEPAL